MTAGATSFGQCPPALLIGWCDRHRRRNPAVHWFLWPAPPIQCFALIVCCGQHCRAVSRSNWLLLWLAPPHSASLSISGCCGGRHRTATPRSLIGWYGRHLRPVSLSYLTRMDNTAGCTSSRSQLTPPAASPPSSSPTTRECAGACRNGKFHPAPHP